MIRPKPSMPPSNIASIDRRSFALGAGAAAVTAMVGRPGRASAEISTSGLAIAMHGTPALADGFSHFPYVDPKARRGGRLTLGVQGAFDSLNPLIVKGNSSEAVTRFVLQGLMM